MATITSTSHSNAFDLIAAPFRAIGAFLVLLAETGPRARALDRLNQTSDGELAARGTTRLAEARRILGGSAYV